MVISIYQVQPGDQLFRIVRTHYGNAEFLSDQDAIMAAVKTNNPHISNVNMIHPGQTIALPDMAATDHELPIMPPLQRQGTTAICQQIEKLDPQTRNLLPSFDSEKVFSSIGNGYLDFVERASSAAINDVRSVGLHYYQMKTGTIPRNRYNNLRRVSLTRADEKLGPLRNLFTPGKTARQAIRIRPHDAVRTSGINNAIKDMDRAIKFAKNGAVILKVADMGFTANQIHTAASNEERSVILVDAVSTTAGAALGTIVAVALVSNPVGWVAIAGIASAGVAGGFIGETFGNAIMNNTLYDTQGNRVTTRLDRAWEHLGYE